MQTVVDRVVLLQQVSDYAVQQLLAQMQERLEHLENTVAAMVAAGAVVVAAGAPKCEESGSGVSMERPTAGSRAEVELASLLGNARLAAVLARAGFGTVLSLAAAGDEQLLKIDGVSEKALRQIREKVPT